MKLGPEAGRSGQEVESHRRIASYLKGRGTVNFRFGMLAVILFAGALSARTPAALISRGGHITCVAPDGRALEARCARILFDSPAGELGR